MPSVMQAIGIPNGRHNLDNKYRATLDHVDPKLSKYNEIIQSKPIEEIYREKLQPAFDAYNAKQKRRDRRLDVKWKCDDALGYQRALDAAAQASKNDIGKKGRPPIRELVLQIGNPEQGYGCKGQTDESRELAKTMLVECFEEIKIRNPQIAWGDVVFHADEVSVDANGKDHGSFHLHASGVPICYENKQGPATQVAFERCLQEQGFSSFEAWKHDLDDAMESVLKRHGLTRDVMDNHEKHKKATEYHRQQKIIKETKDLAVKRNEVAQKLMVDTYMLKSVRRRTQEMQVELENASSRFIEVSDRLQVFSRNFDDISNRIEEATSNYETLQQDIETLQSQKDDLQDAVGNLIRKKGLLEPKVEQAERKLSFLNVQVGKATEELQDIRTAVKKETEEAKGAFTWEYIERAMDESRREREKDRRIKELEQKLEGMTKLIEYFVSLLPQTFRDVWEQLKTRYNGRVQRKQPQNSQRSDEGNRR